MEFVSHETPIPQSIGGMYAGKSGRQSAPHREPCALRRRRRLCRGRGRLPRAREREVLRGRRRGRRRRGRGRRLRARQDPEAHAGPGGEHDAPQRPGHPRLRDLRYRHRAQPRPAPRRPRSARHLSLPCGQAHLRRRLLQRRRGPRGHPHGVRVCGDRGGRPRIAHLPAAPRGPLRRAHPHREAAHDGERR